MCQRLTSGFQGLMADSMCTQPHLDDLGCVSHIVTIAFPCLPWKVQAQRFVAVVMRLTLSPATCLCWLRRLVGLSLEELLKLRPKQLSAVRQQGDRPVTPKCNPPYAFPGESAFNSGTAGQHVKSNPSSYAMAACMRDGAGDLPTLVRAHARARWSKCMLASCRTDHAC